MRGEGARAVERAEEVGRRTVLTRAPDSGDETHGGTRGAIKRGHRRTGSRDLVHLDPFPIPPRRP